MIFDGAQWRFRMLTVSLMASSSTSYLVWLISYGKDSNAHQALFVEIEEEKGKPKGTLFQVQGPEDAALKERVSMWVELLTNNDAFESTSYKAECFKKLVGTIEKRNVEKLKWLCHDVNPPSVPHNHHPKSPNCRSWINKVIYQSNSKYLNAFENGFDIRKKVEKLQI